MKLRRAIIASMLAAYGIVGAAAPAHAGLWCENVQDIEESGTAGQACRAALSVACTVVNKVNGGSGCLA